MKNTLAVSGNILVPKIKKINMRIELVASNVPRLNDMAPEAQLTLLEVLRRYYTSVKITNIDNMIDLESMVQRNPDLVVLGVQLIPLYADVDYDDSPKVWLSTYLFDRGINFTGSTNAAIRLQFYKEAAKQVVHDAGIATSRYFLSKLGAPSYDHDLEYPLFIKPSNRGDGKGIDDKSFVNSASEMRHKINSIHAELRSDALVEEYLSGREFSVAVIASPNKKLRVMPVEIITIADANGNSFLSESIKTANTEEVIAVTDLDVKLAVSTLAAGAFTALGARDYGRIDIRFDKQGQPNFIEANLMPGLSDHGYLYRCYMLNDNSSYEDMVLSIVGCGIRRGLAIKTNTHPKTTFTDETDISISSQYTETNLAV